MQWMCPKWGDCCIQNTRPKNLTIAKKYNSEYSYHLLQYTIYFCKYLCSACILLIPVSLEYIKIIFRNSLVSKQYPVPHLHLNVTLFLYSTVRETEAGKAFITGPQLTPTKYSTEGPPFIVVCENVDKICNRNLQAVHKISRDANQP